MKTAFENIDFNEVRMLSFDDKSVRVVLQDGSEVKYLFRNREEVEAAFQGLLSKGRGSHQQQPSFSPRAVPAILGGG